MKTALRVACASSALLASSLRAESTSHSEDYNLAHIDDCPVGFMTPEWMVMSGSSGDYTLTLTASLDFFLSYETSVNPTQLGASATLYYGGAPYAGYSIDFSYHVDMPFTISSSDSTYEMFGVYYSSFNSDPNASFSGWRQYGNGPQMSMSGRIGTVSLSAIWWY